MLRLGDACGVRLPDRVVAEADTVQDLVDAILRAKLATMAPALAVAARRRLRRAEFLCVLFCGDFYFGCCCFARDSSGH